jgi:hypothetical protein
MLTPSDHSVYRSNLSTGVCRQVNRSGARVHKQGNNILEILWHICKLRKGSRHHAAKLQFQFLSMAKLRRPELYAWYQEVYNFLPNVIVEFVANMGLSMRYTEWCSLAVSKTKLLICLWIVGVLLLHTVKQWAEDDYIRSKHVVEVTFIKKWRSSISSHYKHGSTTDANWTINQCNRMLE